MRDRAFQNKPRRQIELDHVWLKVPLHKFHQNHKMFHRQRLFMLVPSLMRWRRKADEERHH